MPASELCHGRDAPRGGRAGGRALVFALALLAGGALFVSAALADLGAVKQLPQTFADQPVLTNSRAGRFIVRADGMVPGQRARGQVRVANRGKQTGVLYVRLRRPKDTAGIGGAELSAKLLLAIRRVDHNGNLRTVWKGYLGAMDRVRVAVLRPGAVRRYRFVVRFRVHPPARGYFSDNDFQGSRFSTDFVWELVPVR
jgi:hypothetical protein